MTRIIILMICSVFHLFIIFICLLYSNLQNAKKSLNFHLHARGYTLVCFAFDVSFIFGVSAKSWFADFSTSSKNRPFFVKNTVFFCLIYRTLLKNLFSLHVRNLGQHPNLSIAWWVGLLFYLFFCLSEILLLIPCMQFCLSK